VSDRCPCGGIILADTEDWIIPLCHDCYVEYGETYSTKIMEVGIGGFAVGFFLAILLADMLSYI